MNKKAEILFKLGFITKLAALDAEKLKRIAMVLDDLIPAMVAHQAKRHNKDKTPK